ncbi:MAG TPA: gluconate 2-dehydrogenase subunit 3 family protein [Trinickia sp.]|uniref:gluconate 2-dehydrogenase subunit 3 family protein n=1 Tax=Trinickia sp. TaxID=2571163 RepID=UPI002C83B31A|nr:gluconate 2-dehydrogenase subunit 3 family protein [Trinickia sp.]HTI17307.1 gluconate 2-dehydrogenase subunit 3 family protein [Trinickia sp.]
MSDKEETLQRRRGFIKGSIGAAASSVFFLRSMSHAGPSEAIAQETASTNTYQPRYFTPDEWSFVTAAVERLIPSNEDGPGAVDLGVPEFIDRQMDTDYGHGARWYLQGPFHPEADFTLGYQMKYSPREMYRVAIAEINAWSRLQHGKAFAELDGATQDHVLGLLEKGQVSLQGMKANEFFIQLLANTKEGYFADPMYGGNRGMGSWKMIGFPGARADFKDWSTQPGKVYPLGPVSIEGEKA